MPIMIFSPVANLIHHPVVKFKRNPLPLSLGDSANSRKKGIKCQNSNNCLKYHFYFILLIKRYYHFFCHIKEVFKIMKIMITVLRACVFLDFQKKKKKFDKSVFLNLKAISNFLGVFVAWFFI